MNKRNVLSPLKNWENRTLADNAEGVLPPARLLPPRSKASCSVAATRRGGRARRENSVCQLKGR